MEHRELEERLTKKYKSSLGGESSCQQPVGAVCSFQSVKCLNIEDGTSDLVWIDDVQGGI